MKRLVLAGAVAVIEVELTTGVIAWYRDRPAVTWTLKDLNQQTVGRDMRDANYRTRRCRRVAPLILSRFSMPITLAST